jgi:GSCFA family/Polysaccharide biosynthesis enzyme WcbI
MVPPSLMSLLRSRRVRGPRSLLGPEPTPSEGLSRAAVIQSFQKYLGRDPESEAVIAAHLALGSQEALERHIMASDEYVSRQSRHKSMALQAEAAHAQSMPPRRHRHPREAQPAPYPHFSTTTERIAVVGNCQITGIAALIRAMTGGAVVTGIDVTPDILQRLRAADPEIVAVLSRHNLILVQGIAELIGILEGGPPWTDLKLRRFPGINFNAYHPDMVYVGGPAAEGHLQGPMGEYHSAIALWGWKQGLDVDRTLSLFRAEVYEALGYFDYWPSAVRELERAGRLTGMALGDLLERWQRQGCWLYSLNHPKQHVLADVVGRVLLREGIETIPNAADFLVDALTIHPAWPVYPEIGQRLGIPGHYLFKRAAGHGSADNPVPYMTLQDFVAASFEGYKRYRPDQLSCPRLQSPRYAGLSALVDRPQAARAGTTLQDRPAAPESVPTDGNPYRGLPDHCFWRRAVQRVALRELDPVVRPRFRIRPGDQVATAGSCFAQHIAHALRRNGVPILLTEHGDGLAPEEATRRQFGIYSARYGNLYTARQLLQLFDRAFGHFAPADSCWARPDGRQVDAFRPEVEPDGFATADEVMEAQGHHLAAVRRMFESLDIFVFTLGLTEAWRSRRDGAVYPLAPGVVAGRMDPAYYEFVNFSLDEVVADLRTFTTRLRTVSPRAQVLLTVSPVPLIATYEDRHVLAATTYSKSVLRVAAEEIISKDPACDYFPSYEIIAGPPSRGRYYGDDLRSITAEGVAHAMGVFISRYLEGSAPATLTQELAREAEQVGDIICEEELIELSSAGA